jgi:formylglycine-generating enzyme required for sulfatase activity
MPCIHRFCLVCLALLLAALALAFPFLSAAPLSSEIRSSVEPVRHKGYTETIPGSKVRFDMVAIPGGTYLRGSPSDEEGRGDDEGPQHPVQIRPFWMGKMEVTWDEYDLFRKISALSQRDNEEALARNADALTGPTQPYPDETMGHGREGHPVLCISHHAAMEYCRWLSVKTGKAYRLPTEAEWEWAARAGSRTAYFFGETPEKLGDYAWFEKNSEESTHPVGKKKPNPWGLHDIYGNVAEWCLDHYSRGEYGLFPRDRLTLGPVNMPTVLRYPDVVRGGSWADPAVACRSAVRRASDPSWNKRDPDKPKSVWWTWVTDFVGFRVVRAVEEQEELKGVRSKVTSKSP